MWQEREQVNTKIQLPLRAGSEYYEIRLESIGGLGANLCGKMLGELGVKYLDLNSVSFSSYGSEKTGTPVKGYVRYCARDKEIRIHSPIIRPDLLVIFHQALIKDKRVWEGCDENTEVIIALEDGQERGGAVPHRTKACYGVGAQKIAMETHSRINMVMLGAMAKVMGFVQLSDVSQICEDALGKKYPDALKGNLEGVRRGYEEVKRLAGGGGTPLQATGKLSSDKERTGDNASVAVDKLIDMSDASAKKPMEAIAEKPMETIAEKPMETIAEKPMDALMNMSAKRSINASADMPIGGVNPDYGSTAAADLSPSRQGYIPIYIKERCINCGFCDSTCPDMVFQFAKGEYKGREMMVNRGLDYYHCKGCLRCVDVCPVNALVKGLEAEHLDKKYFLPNQDLLRRPENYIEAGPDSYITSESYLTEKRMEGGEV
ncbi:MAG: 2-oxoacid:acceptor oxidoreductase family protein [Clostridium sp.]|nr:2-oxoacid:acceptor oxidoreductase family protein [Clostridium sp.]